MLSTVFGSSIDSKLMHPSKANSLIDVMLSGKVMCFNCAQSWKAYSSKLVKPVKYWNSSNEEMSELQNTESSPLSSVVTAAASAFEGKPAAYMVVFCICAVAYLIGWFIMKTLVPKYKPIVMED